MNNLHRTEIFLIVTILLLSLPLGKLYSESKTENVESDSILYRISQQMKLFPQEKLHVHTDKSYYISGEKIWLRTYLINAYNHLEDSSSLYVYGELINPLDSVVLRIKLINREGVYAGYMQLDEGLPAGVYNMRFYTKFMKNLGEDYFFSKNITIGTPASQKLKAEIISTHYDRNRVNLGIVFKNVKSDDLVIPSNVIIARDKMELSDGDRSTMKRYKLNEERSIVYRADVSKMPLRHIYIQYEVDGVSCSEFLSVPLSNDDFHVDFFPGGGYLLPDIDNILAFKAISSNGFSANVTGIVCKENGDTLTDFKSIHRGMGAFMLRGNSSEKYYAICQNERGISKRFDLPEFETGGCIISVLQMKDYVYIAKSASRDIFGLRLLLHTGGHVISLHSWNENDVIKIPKKTLPIGVIQCLLLNEDGLPLSERLFFHYDEKKLPAVLQQNNKNSYTKRDLVISDFIINDSEGNPLNGNFSVSVTDNKDIKVDSTQNILTSLLLTSELKGNIEDPNFYFQGTKFTNYALDLLMQTQGWRRYNIPNAIKNDIQLPTILPEYSHQISGRVKGGLFLNRKSKNTPVIMLDMKTGSSITTITDDVGEFSFETILPDSLNLMLVASTEKGKTRFDLEVDTETFPDITRNPIKPSNEIDPFFYDYLEKADLKYVHENGMRIVHLKDVEITAQRKEETKTRSMYSSVFTTKIDLESSFNKYSRLTDVLSRIGNAQIVRDEEGNSKVYFRGGRSSSLSGEGSSAAILVDDIYDEGQILEFDPPVSELESLEIIKGPAALLGFRGSGGAVIITTKRGAGNYDSSPPPHIASIRPLGYQSYAEFYSPKYETVGDRNNEKPDLRSTIYWNPNVKVVNGKAKIEFYTADEISTYSVFVDGITSDGQPLHVINRIGK